MSLKIQKKSPSQIKLAESKLESQEKKQVHQELAHESSHHDKRKQPVDKDKDKEKETEADKEKVKDKDVEKDVEKGKEKAEQPQDLYRNLMLEEYIYLKPIDLNNKIDDVIMARLKNKVEGKCIKVGYVIPNSLKILTRSLGIINNTNFDGITMYKIKYSADICNPAIGQIVQCQVFNIDKSQVICYIDNPKSSPLEVFLFKHHHANNTDFAALKIGDIVNVRVGGSKWEYRDQRIIVIAQFVNTV
jgi:DNA-directed RNA polymerase subunit E'/Rpb7